MNISKNLLSVKHLMNIKFRIWFFILGTNTMLTEFVNFSIESLLSVLIVNWLITVLPMN